MPHWRSSDAFSPTYINQAKDRIFEYCSVKDICEGVLGYTLAELNNLSRTLMPDSR